jgi:TfoX/Sxy family transcriptional regulator of competence genes
MAYDEELAHRIRELLFDQDAVTERPMFGGLAFMLAGNMAVAISSRGGLMVRLGADAAEKALADPAARPMQMGERSMKGWVIVDADALSSKRSLAKWVTRGVGFARSLPPKG